MKNNESLATLHAQIPSISTLKKPEKKVKQPQTQKRLTPKAPLLTLLFTNIPYQVEHLNNGTHEHWNSDEFEKNLR